MPDLIDAMLEGAKGVDGTQDAFKHASIDTY